MAHVMQIRASSQPPYLYGCVLKKHSQIPQHFTVMERQQRTLDEAPAPDDASQLMALANEQQSALNGREKLYSDTT